MREGTCFRVTGIFANLLTVSCKGTAQKRPASIGDLFHKVIQRPSGMSGLWPCLVFRRVVGTTVRRRTYTREAVACVATMSMVFGVIPVPLQLGNSTTP